MGANFMIISDNPKKWNWREGERGRRLWMDVSSYDVSSNDGNFSNLSSL